MLSFPKPEDGVIALSIFFGRNMPVFFMYAR